MRADSTVPLYWNKHEATKSALQGEWIRTGDKYFRDADGFYFHGGRADDMIKAGGIWVSPFEVEEADRVEGSRAGLVLPAAAIVIILQKWVRTVFSL